MLTTNQTINLNGNSKDETGLILASFNAIIGKTVSVNMRTINVGNEDVVQADLAAFTKQAYSLQNTEEVKTDDQAEATTEQSGE